MFCTVFMQLNFILSLSLTNSFGLLLRLEISLCSQLFSCRAHPVLLILFWWIFGLPPCRQKLLCLCGACSISFCLFLRTSLTLGFLWYLSALLVTLKIRSHTGFYIALLIRMYGDTRFSIFQFLTLLRPFGFFCRNAGLGFFRVLGIFHCPIFPVWFVGSFGKPIVVFTMTAFYSIPLGFCTPSLS